MNNQTISSLDVAKIYLIAELGKIFPGENIAQELDKNINQLSEKNIWRLLEAMSFTYRLNGVFEKISNPSFIWVQEELNPNNLTLTGMHPNIDKVTHFESVQNNPIKFRDYLTAYFKKYPDSDPEKLGLFRPTGKPLNNPTILVIQKGDKLEMLDGSNRLMAYLLSGGTTIKAIIGKPVKEGKRKIGDSAFLLLKMVYENSNELEKESILTAVKKLMELSSDGREAVKSYWVDHVMDKDKRKPGENLLAWYDSKQS